MSQKAKLKRDEMKVSDLIEGAFKVLKEFGNIDLRVLDLDGDESKVSGFVVVASGPAPEHRKAILTNAAGMLSYQTLGKVVK